jgi:hypothetical protein
MIRMMQPEHRACSHPSRRRVLCFPFLWGLITLMGFLTACSNVPDLYQVVDTGERTRQIYLTRLNSAGEPVWDTRTLNKEGSVHKMLNDGDGGVIIAFMDIRGEDPGSDIYIQRFDRIGNALWGQDSTPLHVGKGHQFLGSNIVGDGAGGAIVVWGDADAYTFYAQRINASGQVLWGTGGVPVVATGKSVFKASVAEDGAGGAFIVWLDERGASGTFHTLYAQHLDAQGHPLWQENGIPLSLVLYHSGVGVVADGSGGLVVVWEKRVREGLYAQRFNADGQPCWEQDVPLPGDIRQPPPVVTMDGQGDFLVFWAGRGVRVQKLDLEGHKLWSDFAIFMGGELEDAITDIHAISDNAGGAFAVWRVGKMTQDGSIYIQHLDAAGNAQWPRNGVLAYPLASKYQGFPQIVSDHAGGVIIFSLLGRTPARAEVYSQRIDADGNLLWSEKGVHIRFE